MGGCSSRESNCHVEGGEKCSVGVVDTCRVGPPHAVDGAGEGTERCSHNLSWVMSGDNTSGQGPTYT